MCDSNCCSLANITRLLEIIFSALAAFVVIAKGRMVNPYGVLCEFVWVFCVIVPSVLTVVEGKGWHILLAIFLPNWADLTCGLSMVCTLMVSSATLTYAVVFVCLTCVSSILCAIFSLAATAVFLVDAVMAKMKCPQGYLSNAGGVLRFTEAFVACIVLAAATNYFLQGEKVFRPPGMLWCIVVYVVCLLVNIIVMLLNLLKLLQCLVSFGMDTLEYVFNIVAVLLYLSAVILWPVFGYKHYRDYNPPNCEYCSHKDLDVALLGSIVNLVLYIVDLAMSIKARR